MGKMDKRKLQTLYVVLGVLGFLMFNYPVINLFMGRVWMGVPALLIYFVSVVVMISVAGFLISRQNEE